MSEALVWIIAGILAGIGLGAIAWLLVWIWAATEGDNE